MSSTVHPWRCGWYCFFLEYDWFKMKLYNVLWLGIPLFCVSTCLHFSLRYSFVLALCLIAQTDSITVFIWHCIIICYFTHLSKLDHFVVRDNSLNWFEILFFQTTISKAWSVTCFRSVTCYLFLLCTGFIKKNRTEINRHNLNSLFIFS